MQLRNRVSRMIPLTALAVACLVVPPARAGYIEMNGSIQASTLGKFPVQNDPVTDGVVVKYGPTSSVAMMSPPTDLGQPGQTDHIDVTDEGSDVTFGVIGVTTDRNTAYQEVTLDFNFKITLTDYASADAVDPLGTATFQVAGRLSGSIGGGRKVNLNKIQSYALTPSDGKLFIGNELLTVNDLKYIPAGANFPGLFTAHIQAQAVPEPSSMALIGLGGLVAWRFRRRRAARA